jgi:hypothetical protein
MNLLQVNVGTPDRIVRIVAGVALVALAATGTIGLWGWIGIVPILTGSFRICPAYSIFGVSTCAIK